jgi:hypothetical protein
VEPGQSLLTFVATVVATAASASGIVLAIAQLTSGARLRSLEATLRAAVELEADPNRSEVLASIHRMTMSRVIGREAVPWRKFLVPLLALVSFLSFSVRGAASMSAGDFGSLALPALSGSVGAVLPIKGLIRLAHERLRIARCYRQGMSPIRAYTDILALNEGGGRVEFTWALLASVGLATGGLGIGLFPGFRGTPSPEEATTAAVLVLVGAMILVAAGVAIHTYLGAPVTNEPRNRDNSLEPTWVQPEAIVGERPTL